MSRAGASAGAPPGGQGDVGRWSRSHEDRQIILVDPGVWIDYLRGTASPQTDKLDALLGVTPLAIGDLLMTEVLQGCPSEREFTTVRETLEALTFVTLGGPDIAVLAARNVRKLRAHDFDPFEKHLGLRCVACDT